MLIKLSIEADSIDMLKAALLGITGANAEDTSPVVLSDQAPSDIVQHPELPFANGIEEWVEEAPDQVAVQPALPAAATQTHPAEIAPLKKRGRKPKLAVVEDIEPPPEVLTEEDEAEGAVDTAEPEPETTGISEAQLREVVRNVMDTEGIPAALALLAKGGYRHVKDIPPADYDRIHAIVKAGARHAG
jgi:plasmid stability protein